MNSTTTDLQRTVISKKLTYIRVSEHLGIDLLSTSKLKNNSYKNDVVDSLDTLTDLKDG